MVTLGDIFASSLVVATWYTNVYTSWRPTLRTTRRESSARALPRSSLPSRSVQLSTIRTKPLACVLVLSQASGGSKTTVESSSRFARSPDRYVAAGFPFVASAKPTWQPLHEPLKTGLAKSSSGQLSTPLEHLTEHPLASSEARAFSRGDPRYCISCSSIHHATLTAVL